LAAHRKSAPLHVFTAASAIISAVMMSVAFVLRFVFCCLAFFDFSLSIALWAAFSFSVLVAVLVNSATERDCPEQHPADTAGVRTDEHVKKQEDWQNPPAHECTVCQVFHC
jgi:hypothetical protein